jgi:hypothetical protein
MIVYLALRIDKKFYKFIQSKLLEKNKKAIMLHDFSDFSREKSETINKYERRFARLHNDLYSEDEHDILFIRINDNLEETLQPLYYYDNIFKREKEDITRWDRFMQEISERYGKRCFLLFITSDPKHEDLSTRRVSVYYTTEHKNPDRLHQIIMKHTLSCG